MQSNSLPISLQYIGSIRENYHQQKPSVPNQSIVEIAAKTIPSNEFQKALEDFNQEILRTYQEDFEHVLKFSDSHFALAITGSDGRGENMDNANLKEIIVIAIDKENVNLEKIKAVIQARPQFHPNIDVKILKDPTDSLLCYDRQKDLGKPRDLRPFPTRALDAIYLAGDRSIFAKYQHKVFKELAAAKSIPKMRSFRQRALKDEVKLLRDNLEGRGGDFHPQEGIFFFDGNRRKGPKYPMLRVVQYATADYIGKLVLQKKMNEEQFSKLPKCIIGRIDCLSANHLLKMDSKRIEKIKNAYTIAMIWVTEGQIKHSSNSDSVTELSVPPKEMQKCGKRILGFANFLAKQDLKKLPNVNK